MLRGILRTLLLTITVAALPGCDSAEDIAAAKQLTKKAIARVPHKAHWGAVVPMDEMISGTSYYLTIVYSWPPSQLEVKNDSSEVIRAVLAELK